MRILLFGNPNAGKSVVFNRLTGVAVLSANYPGTTVEFTRGRTRIGNTFVEVIDVPGTYSLDPTSKAEEVATAFLASAEPEDIVVNVVDATNLERALGLTLQLARSRQKMVVALNFWDEVVARGITIDVEKLSRILGVPCVPLVAITGDGIGRLMEALPRATASSIEYADDERWTVIGRIIGEVQQVVHRHRTFADHLKAATSRPLEGSIIAICVLFLTFQTVRIIGEGLITHIFHPIFSSWWLPLMAKLSSALGGGGILHAILIGRLFDGLIDPAQSFGLLTTGLYIEVEVILPYVFAFYLVLSVLEDSGYLPRLAVLADIVMHRLGMHGMGVIPMLLGLGCNVPGILATRIMESRRERFIAIALLGVAMPCLSQTAMIVGLAGRYGASALAAIFGTLTAVWLAAGLVLNRILPGESPELLTDIPPYRFPYLPGLLKKVGTRMVWFLREAVPWVLVGVGLVNAMYATGMISFIGRIASPVIVTIFGLPPEAAGGLVIGFLRKDVAVGMLAPLGLNLTQTVVACVVLTLYFPCVASFVVIWKELGFRDMLKVVAMMVATATAVGGLLNLGFRILGGQA